MTARLFADADELPARPLTPEACVYCCKPLPGNGQCDASGGPCHGPPERPVPMLDATEPPSCLAGPVTTRADVAPPTPVPRTCANCLIGVHRGCIWPCGCACNDPDAERPEGAQIGHVGGALGVR